jgi:hypothetical protein
MKCTGAVWKEERKSPPAEGDVNAAFSSTGIIRIRFNGRIHNESGSLSARFFRAPGMFAKEYDANNKESPVFYEKLFIFPGHSVFNEHLELS